MCCCVSALRLLHSLLLESSTTLMCTGSTQKHGSYCLHTVSWRILWEQFRKPQLAQGSFLCICDNSGLVLQRSNLKTWKQELRYFHCLENTHFPHVSHLKMSYAYILSLLGNQMHSASKKQIWKMRPMRQYITKSVRKIIISDAMKSF